ncbi:MAG: alpha/beta fold hydrolase [Corynebacteriales bacterium]|nr:alpha/beta fold hydrolase [Mycobacteriales bacterium]
MRRLAILVSVLALTSLVSPVSQAAAPKPLPAGGFAGVQVPELEWTDCGEGAQCATAQLPRDYRDLAGPTIPVPILKVPATDPKRRIGPLFINPGGPGGSGASEALAFAKEAPDDIRARFDIVGFDPRGVASSQAVACQNATTYAAAFAQTSTRADPGAFDRAVGLAREFNNACVNNSGELLPYIGTEFVARDMDVLRAALGAEKISYFGMSYGTYIGTVYANLFPQRTRALLLDGAYDPDTYANSPYEYDLGQYKAVDGALERFLDWCAAKPAECSFGDGRPKEALQELMASLDANPVRDANGVVTANGATFVLLLTGRLNGGIKRWPVIGTNLAAAEQRHGIFLAPIDADDARFYAANVAVECADRKYPANADLLEQRLEDAAHAAPLAGPATAYGPPAYDHSHASACVQWPAEQRSRYSGPFDAKGAAPALVVGNTGDPDTPYQDAVTLSETLVGARLLTWEGEGHMANGRSACAEEYMNKYLLKLTLPAPNTVCTDPPILP